MNPEKQSPNNQNSIEFKRLFLGFSIPANQTELLTALQQQLTPHLNSDAKAIAAENFHLTLLFLGGFPTAQLPQLLTTIDTLRLALFNQTLTKLCFWPGPKILCLKGEACPNLADLAEQVSTQLAPLIHNQAHNPLIKEHCYTPHISLFRKVTRFNQHQAEPCLPERQINLAPRELHLYESRSVNTEQNGKAQSSVRYQILHSWPLMPMKSEA
ncbi:2',5' RNA ligase [Shewanella denitrificans OS217]|uniref:RNA 2',3'-cyclic phosphodiesterase n=1 Tax=Shewanella denitrificans (strain OS217 / ATCC BAA-1090 / DSM 15013) TaxID=318161 RepID=Q12JD3_SHEDO|nr:RNA 2',3'-cyclic phosphodiesterase [Shewanella denitrificans]ABE56443.1 2',5' RNA ligase [Shewanella denitrificans OS217]